MLIGGRRVCDYEQGGDIGGGGGLGWRWLKDSGRQQDDGKREEERGGDGKKREEERGLRGGGEWAIARVVQGRL